MNVFLCSPLVATGGGLVTLGEETTLDDDDGPEVVGRPSGLNSHRVWVYCGHVIHSCLLDDGEVADFPVEGEGHRGRRPRFPCQFCRGRAAKDVTHHETGEAIVWLSFGWGARVRGGPSRASLAAGYHYR